MRHVARRRACPLACRLCYCGKTAAPCAANPSCGSNQPWRRVVAISISKPDTAAISKRKNSSRRLFGESPCCRVRPGTGSCNGTTGILPGAVRITASAGENRPGVGCRARVRGFPCPAYAVISGSVERPSIELPGTVTDAAPAGADSSTSSRQARHGKPTGTYPEGNTAAGMLNRSMLSLYDAFRFAIHFLPLPGCTSHPASSSAWTEKRRPNGRR